MTARDDPAGPIEAVAWPERLTCHVVRPGASPRVRGHEPQALAGLSQEAVWFLALTGRPASAAQLSFLRAGFACLALSAGYAPVHVAILARLCNSPIEGLLSSASLALSEHWAGFVSPAFWDFLEGTRAELPASHRDVAEARTAERLLSSLSGPPPAWRDFVAQQPNLQACGAWLLVQAGLDRRDWLVSCLHLGSLVYCVAEGLHHQPGGMRQYPMNLPVFKFVHEKPGEAP